jgi:cytochrome P450
MLAIDEGAMTTADSNSVGNLPGAEGCPHAGLAARFDPFDISDPFPLYAQARAEEPIFFSAAIGYWVVSRYDDIKAIFRDYETFSSEVTQTPYKPRPAEVQQVLEAGGFSGGSGLSGRVPPDHTRLRRFINKAFTPRRVQQLEPFIRATAVRMIEAFARAGRADLVGQLAYELPALVIFRMLGIPDNDVPSVKAWASSRVLLNFGDRPLDEQVEHALNLVKYWQYCEQLIAERFAHPTDDLPGELVRLYQAGDQSISKHEIVSLCYGQLTAGHETTTNLLGNGLKELLSHPEQWAALCSDASLIPGAVEELLRFGPPVFAWRRKVKRDAEVAGVRLPAGANVLLLLGSANRDAAAFAGAEQLDVRRENAKEHLAFGFGIHYCLGAPLARLEARIVLEELAGRLPGLRLAADQQFSFSPNTSFRGPAHVWAEWDVPAPYVLPFDQCGQHDLANVGGKCAGLGAMLQAGAPVPPGFAITTAAYRSMLEADGIRGRIHQLLGRIVTSDLASEETASQALRALIESAPIPVPVEAALRDAYATLCACAGTPDLPVAVRSSATAEDLPNASFAGQQDTFLWVVGADAVIAHVRRCWASLFTTRAIAYRADHGIGHEQVLMSVAVQKMVNARAAGVAMTLNPLDGDRSKIVIDASWGLGESVVAGQVTPENFVVDKVMLEVVKRTVVAKPIELVADPAGKRVIQRDVEPERQRQPALTNAELQAVAQLAKRAERHYGTPQDIEWAIDADLPAGENVVLLQSRPETVWSQKAAPKPADAALYQTGMPSLLHTLLNPLNARK